jgi:hypothetical protein
MFKIIETKVFPNVWKMGLIIITPVPKMSHPIDYGDLRLVCVLPVLSKVLERLIFQKIMTFLEDRKIIPICQSGLRKHHSTVTALINVFDDILKAFDKGRMTLLILLDFSKAFDTISHKLINSQTEIHRFFY